MTTVLFSGMLTLNHRRQLLPGVYKYQVIDQHVGMVDDLTTSDGLQLAHLGILVDDFEKHVGVPVTHSRK